MAARKQDIVTRATGRLGSLHTRNAEASYELIQRAFERLAWIGGIADGQPPVDLPEISASEQIQALGQILKFAVKYFPGLKSFGDVEKRLMKSLEPGGAMYRRLVELGWTPPAPRNAPIDAQGEEARH